MLQKQYILELFGKTNNYVEFLKEGPSCSYFCGTFFGQILGANTRNITIGVLGTVWSGSRDS